MGGNVVLGIKRLELSGHNSSKCFVRTLAILVAAIRIVFDGRLGDADLDLLRSFIRAFRIVAQFPVGVYADIAALSAYVKLCVPWKLTLDNRKEMGVGPVLTCKIS